MNYSAKQGIVTLLAVFLIVLILALLNAYSSGFSLTLNAFNPISTVEGFIFTLSFGFGLNILTSAFIVTLSLIGLFLIVDWILRLLLKVKK